MNIHTALFGRILLCSAVFFHTTLTLAEITPGQVTAGKVRFTVISPYIIRMEYSDQGKFEDSPTLFAFHREARFREAEISETKDLITVKTGKISLTYHQNGKSFNPENTKATIQREGHPIEWNPGMPLARNLGGTVVTLDGAKGPVDLGIGLLSRDGWVVISDAGKPLLTDDWVKSPEHKSNFDWYLFGYGNDYKGALKAFTTLSGKVPLPRKQVLGSWFSRYWPYSSQDFRNLVQEYADNDFPLDVMVLDMDWHDASRFNLWTGWTWNRELLPDAEKLLKHFHDQKIAVTLNVHPADSVRPGEDKYAAFMHALNLDPSTNATALFNAADKKYMDAFFQTVLTPLEKDGVDFWWLDWQQDPFTRGIPELFNIAWLNHLFYQHSQKSGLRGQSFSRWGGLGDHRNPIHFSGDTDTGFPMLQFEIYMTATAGNVGCFFWSHDIGGFIGERNEEAFTRWIQFGAVSAALRLHSMRTAELDRRPWTFSSKALQAMRKAFHLRSEIFPYIYSQVWKSHEDSIPLIRSLYLEYPEKEEAYHHPQEYFFGDHFLAAPISHEGKGKNKIAHQQVWFPKGVWYNWFSGERFKGPGTQDVSARLDEFPLYVKAGVPVVMQPYTSRMASQSLTHLVVRTYPTTSKNPTTQESTLYEDDGLTLEYQKNGFALTRISYSKTGRHSTLIVSPTEGHFTGMPGTRKYTFEFPNSMKPENVHVNGIQAEFKHDPSLFLTRVEVSEHNVQTPIKIELDFDEAPDGEITQRARTSRAVKEQLGHK